MKTRLTVTAVALSGHLAHALAGQAATRGAGAGRRAVTTSRRT
jgi:hypothetical protein